MTFSKNFQKLFQELVDLVGGDQIGEIEVERRIFGGYRIRISKKTGNPKMDFSPHPVSEAPLVQENGDEDEGLHTISAMMVGVFYRSPSPESPSFVKEGDIVEIGQSVCIIEAMKIMNEIESDIKGRVVRVLIDNGQPVEYHTPLFLLEPL